MNDELHNKVVKFFYDHEELFIAIMNKTPYQSDGWDYEIEVVKEFLTANQSCYCGDIYNLGVIHRDDGPCHYPNDKEPEQEPVAWRYGALLYWDKLDALEFMRTSNDGYQLEPLYTTPQPDKLAYYEKVADDLQALCDKQSLRIAELETQPEQEPVAWYDPVMKDVCRFSKGVDKTNRFTVPLYTKEQL